MLKSSDHVPNGKWRIRHIKEAQQPEVWLAVFSTLANSLLGYAFVHGLAIYFWRLANRGITVTIPSRLNQRTDDDAEAFGIPES